MQHTTAIAVLSIAVAGVSAQWLAWRLRLPAIVLLFTVGLIVGPGLQIMRPAEMFGDALRPLVGLAVAIVVFEGGLGLDFRELRAAGGGILRLTAVAVPVSFSLATLAAHVLGRLGWGAAMVFGAITIVTGPTVILPLLRHTKLERRAAAFLKWEAIVNDPVGAIATAVLLSVLVAQHDASVGSVALSVTAGLVVAAALGISAALLIKTLFHHDLAPEVLKTPMLLALTFGVYSVSNLVMDEAGLAAATVFGIALANLRIPGLSELARFKEALVVLLVSALFIVLTASLDRELLTNLSWPIAVLTAAMVFVIRPLCIGLATIGSDLTWQERALASWIAPRGIVAAAIAGVAGAQLGEAGYPGGDQVLPAVFCLIAVTMVLHGFTLGPVARRLGLTLGKGPGLAIVGGNAWTTDMAEALHEAGVPVLLVDKFSGALARARSRNLPTLQVELLSINGEEAWSEQAMDYLLAATPDQIYNSLISTRLGPELGRARVFQLGDPEMETDEDEGISRDVRGQLLGNPPVPYALFRRRQREGWRFFVRDSAAEEAAVDGAVRLLTIGSDGTLGLVSGESANRDGLRELVHVPGQG
jgi:NhaP-type Na+/H+ or K+/H+ antiporter